MSRSLSDETSSTRGDDPIRLCTEQVAFDAKHESCMSCVALGGDLQRLLTHSSKAVLSQTESRMNLGVRLASKTLEPLFDPHADS